MGNQVITIKRIALITVTVLLISIFQGLCYGQGRGKIYFAGSGKIRRANLNGTAVEDVITDLESPFDIKLDLHNSKLYWVNFRPPKIYRANLDGSNIELIIDGGNENEMDKDMLKFPYSIAIDTDTKKIYWGRKAFPWKIRRADFDGNNIEDVLFRPMVDAENLVLDLKDGKIYLTDSFNDNITRVNLDGSDYEELGILRPAPNGLALDPNNRNLYWTDIWLGRIEKYSINKKKVVTLIKELLRPDDIALHIRSGKMYWVEEERGTQKKKIRSAKLDGSNVTDILTGFDHITGIAIDPGELYDVSPDTNKITTTWANLKTVD